MSQRPMNSAERRAYNQRRHAEQRQELVADRGPQGIAELWWDQARKVARDRGEEAWADLARTLSNYCQRHSE
ncbi:hypothetical protein [Streptosporangium sp. NPDC020145]|uniref:hypothetical protein n=1 Tax=Streptosporangium sp. NPDC020145 TaxID=3154694 RepID=UPI00343ACA21